MTTENYYDGEWRPVTDHSFKALEKLRTRGFELGSDRYSKLMARWPVAPAAPLNIPIGVTIRHSHGRYHATDGTRYSRWATSEQGAVDKWNALPPNDG